MSFARKINKVSKDFQVVFVHLFQDGKFSFYPHFLHIVSDKKSEISVSSISTIDKIDLNTIRGHSSFCMHFGVVLADGDFTFAWPSDIAGIIDAHGDRIPSPYYRAEGGRSDEFIDGAISKRKLDENNEFFVTNVNIAGLVYFPGQENKIIDVVAQGDVNKIVNILKAPFYTYRDGYFKEAIWFNGNIMEIPNKSPISFSEIINKPWTPQ